jgi:hypothetical protein
MAKQKKNKKKVIDIIKIINEEKVKKESEKLSKDNTNLLKYILKNESKFKSKNI